MRFFHDFCKTIQALHTWLGIPEALNRGHVLSAQLVPSPMKLSSLKSSGHWPTLLTAFLYFDVSFMVWTILGALGVKLAARWG